MPFKKPENIIEKRKRKNNGKPEPIKIQKSS